VSLFICGFHVFDETGAKIEILCCYLLRAKSNKGRLVLSQPAKCKRPLSGFERYAKLTRLFISVRNLEDQKHILIEFDKVMKKNTNMV